MQIDPKTTTPRDIIRAATEAAVAAATQPEATAPATAEAGAEKGERIEFAVKGIGVTEDGVIVGIGGSVNVDSDNDVVKGEALVGMAYDFCSRAERTFKGNHADPIGADLVASWPGAPILKSGKTLQKGEKLPDPAVDPVVGINIEKGMETHWFVKVRPHDPAIVDEARKGGVTFSWAGHVNRTEA